MKQITGRMAMVAGALVVAAVWWTAHGDEAPTCERLWEHALEMARVTPEGAAAIDSMTPAELEGSNKSFMQRCEDLTPEARNCVLTREDAAGMERCADEHPSDAAYGVKVLTRLDAIRMAERAYHAMWDTYTACAPTPPDIPGSTPVPFEGGGLEAFQDLGWLPNGPVRCRYSVADIVTGPPDGFTARAECDIDGDGTVERYWATRDERPAEVVPESDDSGATAP